MGIHRTHLDLVVHTLRRPTGRVLKRHSRRQSEAVANWPLTPGAADAVIDSNTRNRSNIANRDKISTDATVRKTRVGRTIQTPARFVQMVHAIVAPNDIYGGTNRMYRNYNHFNL